MLTSEASCSSCDRDRYFWTGCFSTFGRKQPISLISTSACHSKWREALADWLKSWYPAVDNIASQSISRRTFQHLVRLRAFFFSKLPVSAQNLWLLLRTMLKIVRQEHWRKKKSWTYQVYFLSARGYKQYFKALSWADDKEQRFSQIYPRTWECFRRSLLWWALFCWWEEIIDVSLMWGIVSSWNRALRGDQHTFLVFCCRVPATQRAHIESQLWPTDMSTCSVRETYLLHTCGSVSSNTLSSISGLCCVWGRSSGGWVGVCRCSSHRARWVYL